MLQPHPNLGRGPNQLMRLILTQTHAALVTTLQSLSTQPNRQMFMPVMNPSSPSQMHRLCAGPLLGMNLFPTKPAFWLSMKHFVVAPSQITPQSTQTKFRALVLIVGTILLMHHGLFPLGHLNLAQSFPSLQWEPRSNSHPEHQLLRKSCIVLTSN